MSDAIACDGCGRIAFVLRVVDEAKLCGGCVEKSERIDRRLAAVRSDDRVSCDDCDDPVDFDARIAVVVRECGGVVLCDRCESVVVDALAEKADARAPLFGDESKEPS